MWQVTYQKRTVWAWTEFVCQRCLLVEIKRKQIRKKGGFFFCARTDNNELLWSSKATTGMLIRSLAPARIASLLLFVQRKNIWKLFSWKLIKKKFSRCVSNLKRHDKFRVITQVTTVQKTPFTVQVHAADWAGGLEIGCFTACRKTLLRAAPKVGRTSYWWSSHPSDMAWRTTCRCGRSRGSWGSAPAGCGWPWTGASDTRRKGRSPTRRPPRLRHGQTRSVMSTLFITLLWSTPKMHPFLIFNRDIYVALVRAEDQMSILLTRSVIDNSWLSYYCKILCLFRLKPMNSTRLWRVWKTVLGCDYMLFLHQKKKNCSEMLWCNWQRHFNL